LTPLVQAYIGGSLNAQAPGTPQPNEAPQLQPGDAPPTTSVNAGHGPEQPASTEQRLWQFIAECCAESYPVESAAEQINSFVAQHPELGSTVDDVATASANGALLMLRGVAPQVAARPGAKDWLQALQMALQTESVEAQQ
jgi:hypothetical protein